MSNLGLLEQRVHCPYCGEPLRILLDASLEQQDYIEDCQVCCRPMRVMVNLDAATETLAVQLYREDD